MEVKPGLYKCLWVLLWLNVALWLFEVVTKPRGQYIWELCIELPPRLLGFDH